MTTTTPDESGGSRALAGLTEFYLEKVEPPTQAELDRGLDAFRARVGSGKRRRRGLVRWSLASATVLATVAAFVVFHKPPPEAEPVALTYRVDGGSVVEGGYLRESGHAGMSVLFSEGSRFALAAGTRGQIRAVDWEGARVAIERGTASFQVVPNSKRRWLVDVGPFLVTVKGTAFTVSWNPLSEQLDLRLRRGRVVVSGPVSAGEIALRAGQRLVVNLATVETVITEDRPEQPGGEPLGVVAPEPASPPAVEPPATTKSASDRSASPALPAAAKTTGERRWSEDLARGHWDRILKDVDRAGVEATLGRVSSDDLFILADAARYRRRPDLARAALLAQRRRFPDSPRALDAIFLLGRVEETHKSGTARAIAWYDEYLQRAPKGPLVGEALGRKMTLTDRLDGSARARPVAEEYVRRFPKGSYAEYARGLIAAP
jgi:TolA-binding protein